MDPAWWFVAGGLPSLWAHARQVVVPVFERFVQIGADPAKMVGRFEGDRFDLASLHRERCLSPEGDADLAALPALHPSVRFGRAGALVVEESAEPAVADATGVGRLPNVHRGEV
ncbi:MAG: hypothetical protein ACFHWZ_09600 [Phycisphaerales bacterium]